MEAPLWSLIFRDSKINFLARTNNNSQMSASTIPLHCHMGTVKVCRWSGTWRSEVWDCQPGPGGLGKGEAGDSQGTLSPRHVLEDGGRPISEQDVGLRVGLV